MLCQESLRAGSLEFKNRIFMPAMATYKDEPGGFVGDITLSQYRERVAGGNLGLVVSEHLYVSARGRARDNHGVGRALLANAHWADEAFAGV